MKLCFGELTAPPSFPLPKFAAAELGPLSFTAPPSLSITSWTLPVEYGDILRCCEQQHSKHSLARTCLSCQFSALFPCISRSGPVLGHVVILCLVSGGTPKLCLTWLHNFECQPAGLRSPVFPHETDTFSHCVCVLFCYCTECLLHLLGAEKGQCVDKSDSVLQPLLELSSITFVRS